MAPTSRSPERTGSETEILLRLARAIGRGEEPTDVYEAVLDAVRELLGAERSAILLFDESDRMRFHAWRGLSDPYRAAVDGHSPWSRAEKNARPILIPDVEEDESLAEFRPALAAEGIRAIGFVPIFSQDLLGKFMLYWAEPRVFSDHDVALALAVASQVADALERLRLREAERRALLRVERLQRVTAALNEVLTFEEVARACISTISETLEGSSVSLFLLGQDGSALELLDAAGVPEETREAVRYIPLDARTVAAEAVACRRPVFVESRAEYFERHPQQASDASQGSRAAFPMIAGDSVVGVIVVSQSSWRPFAGEDRAFLSAAVGQCALAFERARLHDVERAALRHIEMFAAVLAHDLRNPLGAILNASQLLIQRLGVTGESRTSPLHRIVSSGKRMARLIDQLLDFTQAGVGGGFELAVREADLGDLAEQAVVELQLGHPDWDVKVEARGDLAGTWDPDRLLQVVSNLVANAGQHGLSGAEILVQLDGTDRAAVVLEVENRGTIPAALIPELFTPFRSRSERQSSGLGLGLFITRELVRAHGGSIASRSSEASAVFTVRLPRDTPVAAASPAGEPSRGVQGADSRGPVLLVEDDVDIREGLADVLQDLGLDVVTAVNGLDALNLLVEKGLTPSVILLDLMMPVMDGYRFLEEIRKRGGLASIPIAVVTAGHGVDRVRLGELPIIPKPIELPLLERTLERLRGAGAPAT